MPYLSVGFPNPSVHPTLSFFGRRQFSWAFSASTPSLPAHQPHPAAPLLPGTYQAALSNSGREASWETARQVSSHKNPVYSRYGAEIKASSIRLQSQLNNLLPGHNTPQFTEATPISRLLSAPNRAPCHKETESQEVTQPLKAWQNVNGGIGI